MVTRPRRPAAPCVASSGSPSWSPALAALLAGPAGAFEGEKDLYEAAKKEQAFTWYTAHYDSESAAAVCGGFEKKYPGIKCNYVRTTAQVAYQRLAQDQKAGLAIASLIGSTDQGHNDKMKADGWLMKYRPRSLERADRRLHAVQRSR